MPSDEKARDTRRRMDRVMRRLLELDARAAIDAQAAGANGVDAVAMDTGRRLIADLTDAYGLDADVVLQAIQERGDLQTRAMLGALRITLSGQGHELVGGSMIAGLLTGLRAGLLLADLERDDG